MGYAFQLVDFIRLMVTQAGVQPATFALGVRCSMQLSYWATWISLPRVRRFHATRESLLHRRSEFDNFASLQKFQPFPRQNAALTSSAILYLLQVDLIFFS